MSSGDAPVGIAHDPGRLHEALRRINAARRHKRQSYRRVVELYAGFETLLEALPGAASDRAPDGAGSVAELESILVSEGAEAGADALREFLEPILDRLIEGLLDFPERRLAASGSRLPGKADHHRVAGLHGTWIDGTIEATPDRGHHVSVRVLQSTALPGEWDRLDELEGANRRILAPVATAEGTLVSYVYELADGPGAD